MKSKNNLSTAGSIVAVFVFVFLGIIFLSPAVVSAQSCGAMGGIECSTTGSCPPPGGNPNATVNLGTSYNPPGVEECTPCCGPGGGGTPTPPPSGGACVPPRDADGCPIIETRCLDVTIVQLIIHNYPECPVGVTAPAVGCKIRFDVTAKNGSLPTRSLHAPTWSCSGGHLRFEGSSGPDCGNYNVIDHIESCGMETCSTTIDGVTGTITWDTCSGTPSGGTTPPVPTVPTMPPTPTPPPEWSPVPLSSVGGTIPLNIPNTVYEPHRCNPGDANCPPAPVTAPALAPRPVAAPVPPPTDLGALIKLIYEWALSIVGFVVFAMLIYGGFEWITAAGNPGKIGQAQNRMWNALLGAVLLLSSYLILQLINPELIGR